MRRKSTTIKSPCETVNCGFAGVFPIGTPIALIAIVVNTIDAPNMEFSILWSKEELNNTPSSILM